MWQSVELLGFCKARGFSERPELRGYGEVHDSVLMLLFDFPPEGLIVTSAPLITFS